MSEFNLNGEIEQFANIYSLPSFIRVSVKSNSEDSQLKLSDKELKGQMVVSSVPIPSSIQLDVEPKLHLYS